MKTFLSKLSVAVLLLVAAIQGVCAQGTSFTYQGRLADNGAPVTGLYELRFTLYDTATSPGGNVIAGPLVLPAVGVTNGLFTATLDFGAGVFNGNPRWLEIGVRPSGSSALPQLLLPRQSISPTPYAIQAAGLSGTLPDGQLSANVARLNASNHFAGPVTFNPANGSPFAIAGSSSNKLIRGLNADRLNGKSATDFVAKAGDTMTGKLNLPAAGLTVGGDQLVVTNGNVGIGTTSPAEGKLVVANSDGATSISEQLPGTIAIINSDLTPGNFSLITFNDGQSLTATAAIGTWNTTHALASATAVGDLAFFTKASGTSTLSERMRITSSGFVGIGTVNPGHRLNVQQDDGVATGFHNNIARIGNITFGYEADGAQRTAGLIATGEGLPLTLGSFGVAGGFRRGLTISSDGNVGIGTTQPEEKLSVNGKTYIEGPLSSPGNATLTVRGTDDASAGRLINLYAPWGTDFNTDRYFMVGRDALGNKFHIRGDGAYIQSSSRELKTAIKPIAGPLNILTALQGVYFKWKGAPDSQQNSGFIAEDVAEVFPEASATDKKAVNYPAVIPLLVEGVKELDAKLAKLDQRTQHIAPVDADGVAIAAIQGLHEIVKEKDTEIQELKKRLERLEKLLPSLAQDRTGRGE